MSVFSWSECLLLNSSTVIDFFLIFATSSAMALDSRAVTEDTDLFHSLDVAFAEQIASLNDLVDRNVEVHGDPLAAAPRGSGFAFQHFDDAMRIVQCLDPALAFWANSPFR